MSARRVRGAALVMAVVAQAGLSVSPAAAAEPFTYDPPGKLTSGSGQGRVDSRLYAPGIRFPIEQGPAYANSQVWGHGGGSGPGGSACDRANFSYPWHDNYCETRTWAMPLCPSGQGHQGQDIRAATCEKGVFWAVAAAAGTITSIGSYSVYLTAPDGTRYDYLHMQDVQVKVGQRVKRGERMGKVSNQFGGTATTVHLHFNIRQNVEGFGAIYVPPYVSLVNAYQALMGLSGSAIPRDAGASATGAPPEKDASTGDAGSDTGTTQSDGETGASDQPESEGDSGGCSFVPAKRGVRGAKGAATCAGFVLFLWLLVARRRRRNDAAAR